MYGGGWIYGLSNNRVSIGLVIGTRIRTTRNSIRTKHFRNGRRIRTSKKFSMAASSSATAQNLFPYGGWYSMPRNYVDGGLIIGDSGSFLDSQRLKGIHMAIKSRHARRRNNFRSAQSRRHFSAKTLSAFPQKSRSTATSKKNSGQSAISTNHSSTASTAASFTPACNSSPAAAASSIRCAPKPATSSYHHIDGQSRARALQRRRQAHLRSPHRRLPLRHAPRRRSALPSSSSTISMSAPRNAPSNTAIPANIFVPPPSTKWSRKQRPASN